MQYQAQCLVPGFASNELLYSPLELSFWGGVNASTGQVVDHHHPLRGAVLTDRILAIPSGRGSCTGSGLLLELLLNGRAPAALVFQQPEDILTLGVLVAKALFDVSIPVVVLSPVDFRALEGCKFALIDGSRVIASNEPVSQVSSISQQPNVSCSVKLSTKDMEKLQGTRSPAVKVAMEILLSIAQIQGAKTLLNVTQAHVDACIYTGPASLRFAETLLSLGARFAVPTTLNAISLDYRRWKELGVAEEIAKPAQRLADAYQAMGAKMSFTCAPYLLDSAPKKDEQIGWAESNAVVFANSVLGARTQKYPDFLDVCIALTGRAPLSGCHRDADRLPKLAVMLPILESFDDSIYPLLGYLIGERAGPDIPVVCGLESTQPRIADLKAFGAGFATTSSAPMFHIRSITPEAAKVDVLTPSLKRSTISHDDIADCRKRLNTATDTSVGLVSLGNPHFSLEEFADLARYCADRRKHPSLRIIVTTSRAVQEHANQARYLDTLAAFGAEVITDTCWCMIEEPVIPPEARNIMTNSSKYAHYAPGMVRRGVHFGSLAGCVEAACMGVFEHEKRGGGGGLIPEDRDRYQFGRRPIRQESVGSQYKVPHCSGPP